MSGAAITARGLEKRFGHVTALHPLDLDVEAGATLAVLGPNGAGKSTLLRLLAGLARPTAGSLQVGTESDRRARRRRVGLVAHATFLYPTLSARENLVLAGRLFGVSEPALRADALLRDLELDTVADRAAGAFSRGMAQRLSIARALVHDPDILLLDEPFSGLDARAADRLAQLLGSFSERKHTIVMATHDLARAAQLSDAALVLARGRPLHLSRETAGDATALTRAYTEAAQSAGARP